MRPSVLVTAVKAGGEEEEEDMQVSVVITCAAGLPVVVSRTWQVMGSFLGTGVAVVVVVDIWRDALEGGDCTFWTLLLW